MAKKNKSKAAQKKLQNKTKDKKQKKAPENEADSTKTLEGKDESSVMNVLLLNSDNVDNVNDMKDRNTDKVAGVVKDDANAEVEDKDEDNCKDEDHKAKFSAIATLSLRVDEQITTITALQKQLSELQMKQICLLDGCADFFQELQEFQAKTDEEAKLVLKTFNEVKTKVKTVFEHYLPSQINLLERDMKMLRFANETK